MRMIDGDALLYELTEMVRHNTGEYKYGIQAARLVVMDALTVGGWISVKDRLPEYGKLVLVAFWVDFGFGSKTMITDTAMLQNCGFCGGGYDNFLDAVSIVRACITHWMPLPEAPKE